MGRKIWTINTNTNSNLGWNGEGLDRPAPEDLYVYRIVLFTPQEQVERKGHILLIR